MLSASTSSSHHPAFAFIALFSLCVAVPVRPAQAGLLSVHKPRTTDPARSRALAVVPPLDPILSS